MASQRANNKDLQKFIIGLKQAVRDWLLSDSLKQKDLATMLGLTPAAVSTNLHFKQPMSEGFIRILGQKIPQFSNALMEYYEIKGGTHLSPEVQSAAELRKIKAEKIKRLRAAEEGVIDAIRALTATAIEVLEEKD